ncbi:MAG: hypothetical protein KC636_29645, partial [Myxococcales bacterium]|nr:hypothetical protein [Myxococcales bacterium]
DATREALAAAAKDWHDRAERAGDDSLRARASDAYARFTALFPDDPEANELRYFHGELLWARATDALHRGEASSELFLRSRQEFVEVLERDPGGAHTQDAAYGQLLAARSALGEPGPAPAVKGLGAVPYGAAAQELVDGYRRYLELGPARGLEVGRAAHGWASLAMRHNHFTEARPLLERAIDELDGADETRALAVQSAEMLVDVLTIAWTGEGQTTAAKAASAEALETGLKELAERALWEHPDADRLRAAAATLSASLAWKRAAALYEAGEYRACGEAYTALAEAHPEPARREELRANAAACFAEVADGG